jgi:3-hydroxyacyl-CoA dehydrogenase
VREVDVAVKGISCSTNLGETVQDVDYIQESGPENYEIKMKLYKEITHLVRPDVVIASSTSSLLMTRIQTAAENPGRCIIVHPLNPPHIMPVVELVRGKQTSDEVTNLTREFMLKLGKLPIVLKKEIAGFVVNRLQNALLKEAISLVGQGVVTAPEVDIAVANGLGLRWALIGPFTVHHLASPGGIADKILHQKFSPVDEGKDMRVTDPQSPLYSSLRPAAEKSVREMEAWFADKDVKEISQLRDTRLFELLKLLGRI